MIDTHCHLNDAKFDNDVDLVIDKFTSSGVESVVCVGWDFKSSVKAREIADLNENVYYAVGVHPDECDDYNPFEMEDLLRLKSNKLVAVGEIGLDYYHNKENKFRQMEVFESQISLANKYKLPIIIHCREAFGDMLTILKKYAPFRYGAVMHCYSGSLDYAKEIIKLGLKISFTGSVTFKNATNLQEVAKNIPLDSFFFETDSPYLTPEPNRGKRNEPANVFDIAKAVAKLRDADEEKLIETTDENAKKFFHI